MTKTIYEEESIHVSIQEFSGPLILLLSLIRQHRLDIYDIPLSEITQKYIAEVHAKKDIKLGELSHFFAMIALLIFMKSRTLNNTQSKTDIEGEIVEYDTNTTLIDIVIEYQKFRFLSKRLDEHTNPHTLIRDEMLYEPLQLEHKVWSEHDPALLLKSYTQALKEKKKTIRYLDVYEPVTVQEKISLINEKITNQKKFEFEELFSPSNIMSLVCAILAVLELAKNQVVSFYQHVESKKIYIIRVHN